MATFKRFSCLTIAIELMIGKPPLKYIFVWIPSEGQVPELMDSLSWSGAEIVEKWIPSVSEG